MKTDSELLLQKIEKIFEPITRAGKGINFGPPDKDCAITIKELQTQCEMLEIERYKFGDSTFNIRLIIKRND